MWMYWFKLTTLLFFSAHLEAAALVRDHIKKSEGGVKILTRSAIASLPSTRDVLRGTHAERGRQRALHARWSSTCCACRQSARLSFAFKRCGHVCLCRKCIEAMFYAKKVTLPKRVPRRATRASPTRWSPTRWSPTRERATRRSAGGPKRA